MRRVDEFYNVFYTCHGLITRGFYRRFNGIKIKFKFLTKLLSVTVSGVQIAQCIEASLNFAYRVITE